MLPHNAFIRTDVQQHKLLQPKISKRRIMVKIIIITEIPIKSKENNKKQTTVFHAKTVVFLVRITGIEPAWYCYH